MTRIGSKETSVADKVSMIIHIVRAAVDTYIKNDPEDSYGLINKALLDENISEIVINQIKNNLKI